LRVIPAPFLSTASCGRHACSVEDGGERPHNDR
jgi:hypothetical protein